ncbi:MAG: hypothetical protein ACLT98_07725, partial [Eggerthellaceae bacterium]
VFRPELRHLAAGSSLSAQGCGRIGPKEVSPAHEGGRRIFYGGRAMGPFTPTIKRKPFVPGR